MLRWCDPLHKATNYPNTYLKNSYSDFIWSKFDCGYVKYLILKGFSDIKMAQKYSSQQ